MVSLRSQSHRFLAAACLSALLAGSVSAQAGFRISPCGGGLGKTLQYRIEGGKPGFPFFFLFSMQRASIPLKLIDPRETRSLGVGLDLIGLSLIGTLNTKGGASFGLPIPNDNSLRGKSLLNQAFTYPGSSSFFAGISSVAVTPLELSGSFVTPKPVMGGARAFHANIDLGNGRHLVTGGGRGGLLSLVSYKTTELFDEATMSFKAGPNMTVERGVHTATRLGDGRALLAAGVDFQNNPQNSCEIYDPKTNTFKKGPTMLAKRMGHTATLLADGRVFVAGGLSDLNNQLKAIGSALKSTEIYDPKTNRWSAGPNMTVPRAGQIALRLADGRVLIAGGVSYTTILFVKVPTIVKNAEIYDPKTGRITAVSSLNTERALASAVLLPGGKVLVAGGASGSLLTGGSVTATAELFDPSTRRWSRIASMGTARGFMMGAWLPDGRYALIGGAGGTLTAPKALSVVQAFDPTKQSWSSLPSLGITRAAGTAQALGSCGIWVLGGVSGAASSAQKSQELFIQ